MAPDTDTEETARVCRWRHIGTASCTPIDRHPCPPVVRVELEGLLQNHRATSGLMDSWYNGFMKVATVRSRDLVDEYLQIQVPAITKRHLGIRAAETREPIRVIVLRALKAYGVTVPNEAISDRRKRRPS